VGYYLNNVACTRTFSHPYPLLLRSFQHHRIPGRAVPGHAALQAGVDGSLLACSLHRLEAGGFAAPTAAVGGTRGMVWKGGTPLGKKQSIDQVTAPANA